MLPRNHARLRYGGVIIRRALALRSLRIGLLLGVAGLATAFGASQVGLLGGSEGVAQGATANGRTIEVTFNERAEPRLKVGAKSVTAGRVTLVVENRGRKAHRLVVIKTNLRKRKLPVANGKVSIKAKAVTRVGRVHVGPGQTKTLVLDLEEGRHFLIGNLRGHFGQGEVVRLKVLEPASAAPAPSPGGGAAPSSAGRSLFQASCGICHRLADAGTQGAVGPNLDELSLSAASVSAQVTNGGGGMPAFAGVLTPGEINQIAVYVASVAGR